MEAYLKECLGDTSFDDDIKEISFPQLLTAEETKTDRQQCVICNTIIASNMSMDGHMKECVGNLFEDEQTLQTNEFSSKPEDTQNCIICNTVIARNLMEKHVNECIGNSFDEMYNPEELMEEKRRSDTDKCLICNTVITVPMDVHIRECVGNIFDDAF